MGGVTVNRLRMAVMGPILSLISTKWGEWLSANGPNVAVWGQWRLFRAIWGIEWG